MDRQKSRKSHENRKFPCDGLDFSTSNRILYFGKSKCKRHDNKAKYDMSSDSHLINWPSQPRFHSVSQRQFSTSESSVCRYSVPLSFSFEPVSLPIYPALIQPQSGCTSPLERDNYSNWFKNHKKHRKRPGISKVNSGVKDELPIIFNSSKVNNENQQDYASLPPVNCDIYAAKTSNSEGVCKRRFSDPGIGQVSSDDYSSTRSEDSSNSLETANFQFSDFYTLIEQINELKESNSLLKKELNETKMELETFKMQSLTWKVDCEDFKPGALSDAISEIRNAVKLGEEALLSKVIQMLENNSIKHKEAQDELEEKLRKEMNETVIKVEEKIQNFMQQRESSKTPSPEIPGPPSKDKELDIKQQIVELEQEKLHLKKELQEAVAKRKTAEATTEKLERLVGILRKKINGVSLESCISEDKHFLVRPLASSLEKNPFIIANNRQGQKYDVLPLSKPKVPPFRGFPTENTEGTNVVLFENKENENVEGAGNGNSSGNYPHSETSVAAQVTITGPVTDL